MPDVVELIEAYGAMLESSIAPAPTDQRHDPEPEFRRQRRQRRPIKVLTAAGVALVLVVASYVLVVNEATPDIDVSTADSSAPGNSAGWSAAAPSPLSARVGAAAWSDGNRVAVVGGYAGLVCLPSGSCAPDAVQRLNDGALYDAATDTWSMLPDSPVAFGEPKGAFVGDALFVLAVTDGGPARLVKYDLNQAAWSEIPLPSLPRAESLRVAAAGNELVVFAEVQEPGMPDQVLEAATDTWMALPLDPLAPAANRSMAWAGGRLVLIGTTNRAVEAGSPVYSAATFSTGEGWQAASDSSIAFDDPSWFAVGDAVVNTTTGSTDTPAGATLSRGGQLSATTLAWSTLPNSPTEPGPHQLMPSASGDGWIVHDGRAFDLASSSWLNLEPPLGAGITGATAAWAHGSYFLWGGATLQDGSTMVSAGWLWTPPS